MAIPGTKNLLILLLILYEARPSLTKYLFQCDCDSSSCGFTQDQANAINWVRKRGKARDSMATGPRGDHTSGGGSYLYVNSDINHYSGQRAVTSSPLLTVKVPSCLTFAYHMYGIDMGTLSVGITYVNGSTTREWSQTGKVTTTSTYETDGSPCHFPFTYRSTVYHSCTLVDSPKPDEPWCGTVSDLSKNFKYGRCRSKLIIVSCPTFVYQYMLYFV
ncbi:thyroid hormone-induced protein B-like [Lingula anatina]|uniref:Thyroid hormone-induced protein B-like n=1 Tax=Lingula anatina TaxID=7574 RepID=A0A1S3INB4_LINAN|nr:thyroid hormone-induced protein B-like [Lingula anatina]|eukprot:XP_013399692.1 thyroid hormone-induced protein B-like [Lingula anatina]